MTFTSHPLGRAPLADRREVLKGALALGAGSALPAKAFARPPKARLEWIVSTKDAPWRVGEGAGLAPMGVGKPPGILVDAKAKRQVIEGFGACFNELGWDALGKVRPNDRKAIFKELFGPDGARFTIARMPVGANDFSRDWYSYDETPGDFALRDFSIAHDETSLIPFIKSALRHQPKLRLWASPWSPPTWMKRNDHYASVPNLPSRPANGLRPDQIGREGQDMFILEPRYLDAYARYFGRFIDAYRAKGIRIGMVMPQNEFNSPQPFPSCCWTPEGLASFIPHLGREMAKRDVQLFLGTLERADAILVDRVLADPVARSFVKGVGVQWAGKNAVAAIHSGHPELRIYQTEQECGNGKNSWGFCRYTWSLMKQYLTNGSNAYLYWNLALMQGGVSRWGWAQNSLITVDEATGDYHFNHEYWLMKHMSHFVQPGATRIEVAGYQDILAFSNADGSTILVAHNPTSEPMPLRIGVAGQNLQLTLPPDSFSSLALRG
jgi:glucosylceramidase